MKQYKITTNMAWENCAVTLNSDSTGSFYTGDIVTGTVFLEFKTKQKVERIEFIISGKSKVEWTRPKPTIPHIKFYSEKKKLLYIDINLFENIKDKIISPGVYTYPFHFVLPEDLPSTFESNIAKVNYCIRIKSQGVWGHNKVVPFVVLGNVNINHIEKYLEPYTHEFHKTCWNEKTLSFYIKTFTGFASKQSIPFEIMIQNHNNVKILKISVKLIQKLHYVIKEGHMNDEKKMYKVEHDHFYNYGEEKCAFVIDIPHLTPSSIHIPEPTVQISYVFRVAVKFVCHSSVFEDIPVTVATVPVIHYDFNDSD